MCVRDLCAYLCTYCLPCFMCRVKKNKVGVTSFPLICER